MTRQTVEVAQRLKMLKIRSFKEIQGVSLTLPYIYPADEFAEMGWAGMGGEHAVILMNHHYELDWLYGWMVADRANILGNGR